MSRVADPKARITLLKAAEEIFAERGLAGAKVEDIAKRAGVSKGAFYLHFDGKEAALRQLVESFLARCQSYFAAPSAYPSVPEDAPELLDFLFERDLAIYEFLWQNRAFLRMLPSCQGEQDYLVQAFRTEIHATTREWVEHFRRDGFFREAVDPELAATLIGGAYHELSLRLLSAERRPPIESWLEFALDAFCRAFGTQETLDAVEARNPPVSNGIDSARGRASAGALAAESSRAGRSAPRTGERGRIT